MTESSLDVVMTPERVAPLEFSWNVPAGWEQGRGAFGGIVVGSMLRAAEAVEADTARQVRSITAELVGPVAVGPARLQVELLRRGNAVSTWRAWISQANELLAHAVIVLGAPRPGTPSWSPTGVPIPALPAEPAIMVPGIAPVFSQQFEYRPTGPLPFSAHREAIAEGFVHARGGSVVDAAYVAAHADAYWLAAMATFDMPRPAATVAFTLHLQGLPESAEQPLFHRAASSSCNEGYSSETRELFTRDGRLLAVNHQIIAIIK